MGNFGGTAEEYTLSSNFLERGFFVGIHSQKEVKQLGNFLKIIAFVLLGIGGFLVYGAKLVAQVLYKHQDGEDGNAGKDMACSNENPHADMQEYDQENTDDNLKPVDRKVLNIKMAGMFFVIAGGILVILAFS